MTAGAAQPWLSVQDSPAGCASWDELVRVHSPQVYRRAYRLTRNRQDAEDLVQDVFLRVFRSLPNHTPRSFEGWLDRITLNLFLDRLRRCRRIRFVALPDDLQDTSGNAGGDPQRDDRIFSPDVERALQALSQEYFVAVVLRDLDGFTYEEIAATLNLERGTVSSRIHRGRQQLRAALIHRTPQCEMGEAPNAPVLPAGHSLASGRS